MNSNIKFDATFFRGRVAVMTALKAMNIGDGDEVILQAYTCVAVPEGILAANATPCFVDIDPGTVTMSAEALESAITKKTKAVIIQHSFGYCANMEKLIAVAKKAKIFVIEDCAHTYWSEFNNQTVGTFGDAAIYSLEWGKPLVVGVGGGLIVNNDILRDVAIKLHNKMQTPGMSRDLRMQAQYYAFTALYSPTSYWKIRKIYQTLSNIGVAEKSFNDLNLGTSNDFNLRLSSSASKRLKNKLRNFKPDWQHNQSLVDIYLNAFSSSNKWKSIPSYENARNYLQRLPFWVEDKQDALKAAEAAGFELSDWFESAVDPLSENSFSQVNYTLGSCPNAEHAAKHIVSLPCLPTTNLKKAKFGAQHILKQYA